MIFGGDAEPTLWQQVSPAMLIVLGAFLSFLAAFIVENRKLQDAAEERRSRFRVERLIKLEEATLSFADADEELAFRLIAARDAATSDPTHPPLGPVDSYISNVERRRLMNQAVGLTYLAIPVGIEELTDAYISLAKVNNAYEIRSWEDLDSVLGGRKAASTAVVMAKLTRLLRDADF